MNKKCTQKNQVMEITTYRLVTEEEHILEGRETRFKVLHEIRDSVAFYPTTGDKEYPNSSCDWRNPYDDDEQGDWNVYRILKREYHEKYGPLTLKQYIARIKQLMDMYPSCNLLNLNKRYVRRAWIMKQMYELADNSMGLLLVRCKKAVIAIYERAVKFKNEVATILQTKEMRKYITMAINVMDAVCDKINAFFLENPILISSMNVESQAYFMHSAPPAVSTFMSLQTMRWIEPSLVPHVESKYYPYCKDFWSSILMQSLYKIWLGPDICKKIAEFLPKRIKGGSFIDFFRKHYDMKNMSFIGRNLFVVTCNMHENFNEIVVILK